MLRNLLILITLLFQLSFGDILARVMERTFAQLQTIVVSVDMPRVSEGRLLPPMTQEPPCAIGLSYPATVVCRTPTPSQPSEGG